MSGKPRLTREEARFSKLKGGINGIGLGEEDQFVLVKKKGDRWCFSLWDLMPYEALTGVVCLRTPELLRSSPKAKAIRDKLKTRWSNTSEIIESILIELRYHQTEFVSAEVADEGITFAEKVERTKEFSRRVRIHPLIDYDSSVGLCVGGYLQPFKKGFVFANQNVFPVDSESLLVKTSESNSLSIRDVKACRLHRMQNEILIHLAADSLKKVQIEIPTFSEVFRMLLKDTKLYYWHTDDTYYVAVACWIIGGYMFPIFDVYPILHAQGLRETGKSTLIFLLRALCWNPTNPECSLREADLFRTIEGSRPTYLMDLTKLPRKAIDVLDVFESGYERGGSVRRCEPLTFEPVDFQTFSPKACATRSDVPFSAKAITIITTKADDPVYTKRRIHLKGDPQHKTIVRDILKVVILGQAWKPVLDAYHSLEQTDKLTSRRFRLWQPLLAICKVFAPERFEELLQLAEKDAETREVSDRISEVETAVITVLAEMTETETQTHTILLKELTEKVTELVPWVRTWHVVKSALRNLGIVKRAYSTREGVTYQLDMVKVHEKARTQLSEQPEPESVTSVPPPIQDVYEALRSKFKESFYEQKAVDLIIQLRGCDLKEAEAVFKQFVDEGKVFMDSYGLWRFVS